MSNSSVAVLLSGVLLTVGSFVSSETTQEEVAQLVAAPPLPIATPIPSAPIAPSPPAPIDEVPPLPDNVVASPVRVGADPSRVGTIRLGNGTTQIIEFEEPAGVADACEHTTCNAKAGSKWRGLDGNFYQKQADGTFIRWLIASERMGGIEQTVAVRRPVGNWGTAAKVATCPRCGGTADT